MMFSTAASSIEKKALPFVASDRKHEFWEEFFLGNVHPEG